MRSVNHYRMMPTGDLLEIAHIDGIDPNMAVVMAERMERMERRGYGDYASETAGGRYFFNYRSVEECTK